MPLNVSIKTISIMDDVHKKGKARAKELFGQEKRFSTYVTYLINKDWEEQQNKKK